MTDKKPNFDLTSLRQNILAKYSGNYTEQDHLDTALLEIGEDRHIFDTTYQQLFIDFVPKTEVYMNLCKRYTPATAKSIVAQVSKLMQNPVDLFEENNKTLNQIDHQIKAIREVIRKIELGDESVEGCDIELFNNQLRSWITLRSNIIRGISQDFLMDKKIQVEMSKVNKMNKPRATSIDEDEDLSELSDEELQKLLEEKA